MMRKLVLKSTTKMSLNERFTQLRNNHAEFTVHKIRENNALRQQASIKNQRLAQQMERRPAVIAALRLKKKSVRQRLGQPMLRTNIKDRLSFGERVSLGGRLRGRGRGMRGGRMLTNRRGRSPIRGNSRGRYRLKRSDSMTSLRSLRRSQSITSLNRSTSMTSLNKFPRGRGVRGVRGSLRRPYRRGGRGGQFSQRGIYGRRSLFGNRFPQQAQRGRGRGTYRGRGRGRGQFRRGRGARQPRQNAPTKELLDMQLDEYMASTKSRLDKDLDSYMHHSESWD